MHEQMIATQKQICRNADADGRWGDEPDTMDFPPLTRLRMKLCSKMCFLYSVIMCTTLWLSRVYSLVQSRAVLAFAAKRKKKFTFKEYLRITTLSLYEVICFLIQEEDQA